MSTELVLALTPQTLEVSTVPPLTLDVFVQAPVLVSTAQQGPPGLRGLPGPPGEPGPPGQGVLDSNFILDGGNF